MTVKMTVSMPEALKAEVDKYPQINWSFVCQNAFMKRLDLISQYQPGKITAAMFLAATGNSPEHDDLERANCEKGGESGHHHCGWNHEKHLPRFMTEPLFKE